MSFDINDSWANDLRQTEHAVPSDVSLDVHAVGGLDIAGDMGLGLVYESGDQLEELPLLDTQADLEFRKEDATAAPPQDDAEISTVEEVEPSTDLAGQDAKTNGSLDHLGSEEVARVPENGHAEDKAQYTQSNEPEGQTDTDPPNSEDEEMQSPSSAPEPVSDAPDQQANGTSAPEPNSDAEVKEEDPEASEQEASESESDSKPEPPRKAPVARAKRKAATAAIENVKSYIAKEGASDTVALEENPRRSRKKQKVAGPSVVPINVQPSLSTLEVPVLVKSQEGLEILVRVAGTDALKAHGITEQSIFASALVKDLATKSEGDATKSQQPNGAAKGQAKGKAAGKGAAVKLNRKQMQALRLRPDGTPKRKYTRKTPAPNQGAKGKDGSKAQPVKAKDSDAQGPEAKKAPVRNRSQRQGRARGKASARQDTPPSSPDPSDESSSDDEPSPEPQTVAGDEEEPCDELFGCSACRWTAEGCNGCRQESPVMRRPKIARWQPEKGRPQEGIPEAPTFFPTEEEFADPLSYINKIREHGERAGIACIVPPKGWAPPFALDKGTNGQSADSFRFSIRKQPTWQLCMRQPNPSTTGPLRSSAAGRVDAEIPNQEDESHVQAAPESDTHGFGFVTLDRTHTLASFEAYAKWAKRMHFSLEDAERDSPSVDEIEAEFWRIVETPAEAVENLYGQDLDSGHHGSGFPLPPSRKKQLEELLAHKVHSQQDKADSPEASEHSQQTCITYTPEEQAYSEHCWNINNLPRCKGSILRYVIGDELITGVMVPWLYVGSCMSAFCWHIEDHALYSINYLHKGAPKIWYGVPSNASEALEKAMKDAFPQHFETAPDLLYQLVTMLSPSQLKARGVPVSRVVHREGSFVITFPNAYHSGFNAGFNCAEAVNFAPPDWLPWGCNILTKYRRDGKAATLSSDALLIALVQGAQAVSEAASRRAEANAALHLATSQSNPLRREAHGEPNGVNPADSPGGSSVSRDSAAQAAWNVFRQAQEVKRKQEHPDAARNTQDGTVEPANVPGQRADTSYLDAIKVEDAPAHAVRLAAAELRLRVQEERRRREIGLKDEHCLQTLKMTGQPGDKDEQGLYINTEDMDCQECKCDLWLSAVVSRECPDKHYCPEHAPQLETPEESWILLYRYTLEDLDDMLDKSEQILGGIEEARAIVERVHNPPQVEVKKLGPVANLIPQTPAREDVVPTTKGSRAVKKEKKPAVKPEDKSEDGLKSEISHYSPDNASRKRPRRAVKSEAGVGSRKMKRGPGKRTVTLTVETDSAELDEACQDHEESEGWSPVVDDGAIDEDSDSAGKRGRGRGKGRGRGRGGRGEGRGRGRGSRRRQPESSRPSAESEDPASPGKAISEAKNEAEQQEMSEPQEIGQTTPESSRSASPMLINAKPGTEDDPKDQADSPGEAETLEAAQIEVEDSKPQAAASTKSAAEVVTPGESDKPQGQSVLMDILRASAGSHPQGHVTKGSTPRSSATGIP